MRRFFAYSITASPTCPTTPSPRSTRSSVRTARSRRAREDELDDLVASTRRREQRRADEPITSSGSTTATSRSWTRSWACCAARSKELGLWERTLVIVTADHGEELGEHGFIGHDAQLYRRPRCGSRSSSAFRTTKAGGAARPRRWSTSSTWRRPSPTSSACWAAAARPRRSRAAACCRCVRRPRQGRDRLAHASASGRATRFATAATSSSTTAALATRQLFDLAADPEERQDLAAREPLLADFYLQALRRRLLDMRAGARTRGSGHPAQRAAAREPARARLRALMLAARARPWNSSKPCPS